MADEAEKNTTPVESGDLDTTHAPSGNEGTTPPEAEKTGTTPPEGGNELDVEKIIKKRLERERRKWEAEREEAERRARMDEAERLKAELADRDKAIAEAKAAAEAAERRAALTGKVADPAAALKLLDPEEHVDEEGNVNVDALLKSYPFLAPQQSGPTPTRSGGGSAPTTTSVQLSQLQEQLGKARTRQERIAIQRRIHEIQKGK